MPGMNNATARSGFIPELNGLRAIAIILVFLCHVRLFIPDTDSAWRLIKTYLGLGWVGVDLFFVLSGFLITGILLDTRNAKNYFSGFYVRRILRIFPLYYAVLTAVILAGMALKSTIVPSVLPIPQDRWLYYSYLTNWLGLWKGQWGPNYLAHFWSLAVEEQFYLVWPLAVWLLPYRAIPRVAAALTLVAAAVRVIWIAHSGADIAIGLATVCRMDSLFVGAICAYLFRNRERMEKIRVWLWPIVGLGLGTFLLAFSGVLFFPRQAALVLYGSSEAVSLDDATLLLSGWGGYTFLALGFGALVLLAAHGEEKTTIFRRILRTRTLGSIGTYSYGIYVFHVPILGATLAFVTPKVFGDDEPTLLLGLCFVFGLALVTYIVSAASYEFFERKILALKRYFEPRYASALSDAIPLQAMAARAVSEASQS
jgi:peptidoglycan/LPS O-acetylase OafA/YrhL